MIAVLRALTEHWFGDMVKLVVDIDRGLIAIGGELHADAEAVLLEHGSRHADVWGANDRPGPPVTGTRTPVGPVTTHGSRRTSEPACASRAAGFQIMQLGQRPQSLRRELGREVALRFGSDFVADEELPDRR